MAELIFNRETIGYSYLRKNLSEIMSEAINQYKEITAGNAKKGNANTVSIISTQIIDEILKAYIFSPKISFDEQTKQYEIVIKEIDGYGFGYDMKEAVEITLDNVVALTEDYFKELDKYIRFDEYRNKYPYFLRIWHCNSKEEIKKVLGL